MRLVKINFFDQKTNKILNDSYRSHRPLSERNIK
jgi:hypothetical protein